MRFDKNIAIEMGNLASLAYAQKTNQQQFIDRLNNLGYKLLNGFNANVIDKSEIFGYVAESSDKSVLAYRGTESIFDFMTDFQSSQIPYKTSWKFWNKPMVHKGFYDCFNSCLASVLESLSKITKPLYITGHSLGSSIGLLASIEFQQYKPITYIFACPKTGNKAFINKYTPYLANVLSFVNKYDLVPCLPPDEMVDDFRIWQYSSLNNQCYVSFQHYDIIENHAIDNYIEILKQ